MQQEPATILVVDRDAARRALRVAGLLARNLRVEEVDDPVGAMKRLPQVLPDVLVLAVDTLAMDVDTVARGVASMPALEHLQLLVVGEGRPMSARTLAAIHQLPGDATPEVVARECERLAARARRRRQPA